MRAATRETDGFHLKMDTGMGRLGMPPELWQAFLEYYRQLKGIVLKGVLTHLASAEDPEGAQTREQLLRFSKLLRGVEIIRCETGVGPRVEQRRANDRTGQRARAPGEYGSNRRPPLRFLPAFHLRPASGAESRRRIRTPAGTEIRVVFLKDVPAGAPLGYGGTFRTRRPSRIATVPIGYADGLSRKLSNRGRAIVRDHYAPIVGNISMD